MKDYAAILLVLLLPFALTSCGGSSDGEEAGTEQKETPPSSTPEAKPQIYTFSDDSSLTPNVAFATDEEMVIVLGSDLDGKEMPFKSVFLQRDGIGSMLVEISANGLPSAIIAGDAIFKINKYSYAEGKWFMHFSADQNGTISDLTVELPQSFGAHISNLDSWMRNRINTAYQASALQNQSQSNARNIKTEEFLEFVAVTVELGACGISAATANPLIIFWACQSAVRSTIDFLDDAPLVSPTNLDTQKCFFGIGENGISFMDPACLVATGLRIAADRVRDGDSDISEMEELADKSMDENRFIGEDPVIEDFPTPLLTAPQVAIISPQWRETFTSEQDVRIQVAASEGVEVIDYEVRSKESGASMISGNTGKSPSGNFEIDIAAENLESGTYFVTVSATSGELSTQGYSSFIVEEGDRIQYIIRQNELLEELDNKVHSVDGNGNHIWYAEFLEIPGCEDLIINDCLKKNETLNVNSWTIETSGDIVGDMVSRGRIALMMGVVVGENYVSAFEPGDTLGPVSYIAGGEIDLSTGGNGWFFPGTSVNFRAVDGVAARIHGKAFNCSGPEAEECERYNDAGPPINVSIQSEGPITFSAGSDKAGIKVNITCNGPGPNMVTNTTLGTTDC